MLKKPKNGWGEIIIGDWCDRCSYIDNVPVELLKAFIRLYRERTPSAVKFDAEGWKYIIVFDWYEIHVITEKNKYVLKTVSCDINTLAKELVKDIRSNINEWAEFYYEDLDSVDNLNLIDNLCDILEDNIKNQSVFKAR